MTHDAALPVIPTAFDPFRFMRRWCAWRHEKRTTNAGDVRTAKAPYISDRRRARVNAPAGWLPIEGALDLAAMFQEQGARAGVGTLLGPLHDGSRQELIAVDLDAARGTETGALAPWAAAIVTRFSDTYREESPSGRGAHVMLLANSEDVETLRAEGLVNAVRTTWAQPSNGCVGAKVPAIELLTGGFVTITGRPLEGSPQRIAHANIDDLRWLVCEAGPALRGDAHMPVEREAGPPAVATTLGAGVPRHVQDDRRQQRDVRFTGGRLARFAADKALTHDEFQFLGAHWWQARSPSHAGFRRSSVPHEELMKLPGARRNSRRSSRTVTAVRRRLETKGLLRSLEAAERPWAARQGKARVHEVVTLLDHDPARRTAPPDMLRLVEEVWADMLFSLPPIEFRLLAWLLATRNTEPFGLAALAVAETFAVKRDRADTALRRLVREGWLECDVSPRCGRPGCYRLSEKLRGPVER